MGRSVRCDSNYFLLQREDQPAALEALREFLRECPGDFRLQGELVADDLVSALAIGDWHARVDEHGDIIGLGYGGDYPPRATDDFPVSFFRAVAPFVQYGSFFRKIEEDPALTLLCLKRGDCSYRRRAPGVRLEQRGEPPLVRAGESVVVELVLHGCGVSEGVVELQSGHSTQVEYEFESRRVPIDDIGRVKLTLRPGAADPVTFGVSMTLDGVDQFDAAIAIRAAAPPEQADTLHEVIASKSPLDQAERSAVIVANDLPLALQALRRYATRYAERSGAEFLRNVLSAPDLQAALRAAELETALTGDGDVHGFRFIGSRLPGYERYLSGLFASLRAVVQGDTWFSIAYAHDPKHWVHFSYEWGEPSRNLWER